MYQFWLTNCKKMYHTDARWSEKVNGNSLFSAQIFSKLKTALKNSLFILKREKKATHYSIMEK